MNDVRASRRNLERHDGLRCADAPLHGVFAIIVTPALLAHAH